MPVGSIVRLEASEPVGRLDGKLAKFAFKEYTQILVQAFSHIAGEVQAACLLGN